MDVDVLLEVWNDICLVGDVRVLALLLSIPPLKFSRSNLPRRLCYFRDLPPALPLEFAGIILELTLKEYVVGEGSLFTLYTAKRKTKRLNRNKLIRSLRPDTMSRSAADATRFTATGPYASSKPGGTPYKLPSFMAESKKSTARGPGERPETPKEKVERLRAQARAARLAQSTTRVDQMIDVGRRFANKAHKVMVYSLITASGRCLGSMPSGNPPSSRPVDCR
jgi:hypothetical protein